MRCSGANSLSVQLRAYTPFLQRFLVLYYPFLGGRCWRHRWRQEQSCSNQHYCRLDRPSIVHLEGKLPCLEVVLPIFVRLVLSVPIDTASIIQRAELL